MRILYFTATGNSLHVAKSLGGETYSIPKMVKEERFDFTDNKIGVVFPLYAWSVPKPVADFLRKATFNCDYLFGIFTYGVYDGACTTHLMSIAEEAGYKFDYINKVRMVDNYIIGFDMKKQVKNEYKKEIGKQIEAIKTDVERLKNWRVKDNLINKIGTNYMLKNTHKSPYARFSIEDSCTKCGICAKVCPIDNINVDDKTNEITINDKCVSCFACTHNCPTNSIRFKGERSKNRFRNSNVTLSEIIQSNS